MEHPGEPTMQQRLRFRAYIRERLSAAHSVKAQQPAQEFLARYGLAVVGGRITVGGSDGQGQGPASDHPAGRPA